MLSEQVIIQKIIKSDLFHRFCEAYGELTNLPLALRSPDYWYPPLYSVKRENPLCSAVCKSKIACSSCLKTQLALTKASRDQGKAMQCDLGLVDIAVPVKACGKCIGYLYTGQFLSQKQTKTELKKTLSDIRNWQLNYSPSMIENSFLAAEVYEPSKQQAIIELLTQFAERVSEQVDSMVIKDQMSEPIMISRAKSYMKDNYAITIKLSKISDHLKISQYHFCRQFKKYTGLSFTDYLNRLRIEEAKLILIAPNCRVGEVAYEVGFQSVPHFSRSFKRIAGMSPKKWRERKSEIR